MASKRRGHILTENRSTALPRLHVFFDTETTRTEYQQGRSLHDLRLVVGLFWRRRTDRPDTLETSRHFDARRFWEWVESKTRTNTRLVMSAHNLNYDLQVLDAFRVLPNLGWTLEGFYVRSPVSIYRWRKGSRSILMVDNLNYFRGPLAEWGKTVGQPKAPMPSPEDPTSIWLDYCEQDVRVILALWQSWYGFLERHDCGAWTVTVSAQAFHAYRHRFIAGKVWLHDNESANRLERESYRGGRVEVLRQGTFETGPFFKVDVNSMYPSVMALNAYPRNLYGYRERATLRFLERKLERYCVVARVRLETPEPCFPFTYQNRTCYPVGRFSTVLTTRELQLALSAGWVKEVREVAWYRSGHLFTDYVHYFHDLKVQYQREGNTCWRELTKLLLCSLYGKFGQYGLRNRRLGDTDPNEWGVEQVLDRSTGRWERQTFVAGSAFVTETTGESRNSFPAIAAHITADARLALYNLLCKAGRSHVYYVDTDGLIVDREGHDRLEGLLDPDRLGAPKLEARAGRLEVHARKDYVLGERRVCKGVRSSARWVDQGTVTQEHFPTVSSLIRREPPGRYVTYLVTKRLDRQVYGARVDSEGYCHPLEVSC